MFLLFLKRCMVSGRFVEVFQNLLSLGAQSLWAVLSLEVRTVERNGG